MKLNNLLISILTIKAHESFGNSYYLNFIVVFVSAACALFIIMQKQKQRKKVSSEQLASIKTQLEEKFSYLKNFKVKRFYSQGKVRVRATYQKRKIHATGSVNNIVRRFSEVFTMKLSGLS